MATNDISTGSDSCVIFECGPCQFHGSSIEADAYCFVCNEYLCGRCRQTHEGQKMTRDHTLARVNSLDRSCGLEHCTPKPGPKISVDSTRINSCVFLTNGKLILTDETNDSLIVYDANLTSKSVIKLKGNIPWDIAALNDQEVFVTKPFLQSVQFVRIEPQAAVVRKFSVGRRCFGIAVYSNLLYITAHDDPGNGEIIIASQAGAIIRKIGMDNHGAYRFIAPFFIRITPSADRLYVSDANAATVTCMDLQGHVLFTVSDPELQTPRGLFVDDNGNALVCGADSDTVHLVRFDGTKQSTLISRSDLSSKYPRCLCYRKSERMLVVVCKQRPLLVSFKL